GAEVQVGAQVSQQTSLEAEHRAIALTGNGDEIDLVATMRHGRQVLAAILQPADRPSELHRQPRNEHLVWVDVGFRPETSANFGRNDPHLVFAEPEDRGDLSS